MLLNQIERLSKKDFKILCLINQNWHQKQNKIFTRRMFQELKV